MSNSLAVGEIEDWCDFGFKNDRAYILRATARATHNDELTHNTEITYRKVLRSEDEIARQYEDLLAVISNYPYTFRIYLTVNARDIVAAYFQFQEELNSWARELTNGDDNAVIKMGEIGSRWVSALHAPEVKDDSNFQFDLDDVSSREASRFVESLRGETEVLTWRRTPNGYHILTAPFDYTDWNEPVEYDDLSSDGLLFIEEVGDT